MFSVSPTADTKALEQIFRHKVLKMLLAKGKITQDMFMLLVVNPVFSGDKWQHTGFNVFFGPLFNKLVGAQADFSAGVCPDGLASEYATESSHNLYITKPVQLTYVSVFSKHVTVGAIGFSYKNSCLSYYVFS